MKQTNQQQATDIGAGLTAPGAPFEMREALIEGIPVRIFCNAPQTLGAAYRGVAAGAAAADATRVLSVAGEDRMTYAETLRKAEALSRFLQSRFKGLRNVRVAIAMNNRPEWLLAFLGITAAGGCAVLVNSRGTGAEIVNALRDTDAVLVIADQQRAALIAAAGADLPLVVVHDESAGTPQPNSVDWRTAIAGWESAVFEPVLAEPEDEAIVMFTSGTTGGSKAALLTQRSVMTGLMNIQYAMAIVGARIAARVDAEVLRAMAALQPSALMCMPLFHSSGCYAIFLSNFLRGGKIVFLPKWHAEQALALIEREKIMAFSGSPAMLWDVLRFDRSRFDLSSLRSLGVGGQAMLAPMLREVANAFPRAVMGGGYGMTEANGSVCMIAGEDLLNKPSASGRVTPSADLKIVDDAGVEVAHGAIGEVLLRGAMIMRGYCRRPDDTAAVLRDGWLHTGDLGRLDDEGFLHILDRKKDIVISGGENISCTEVEAVAMTHPAVADAAVFAVPDERLGERLIIAIVPHAPAGIDAEQLQHHVGEHLAIYKVPRGVMLCAQLPRNALGKAERNTLRQQFLQLQDDTQ